MLISALFLMMMSNGYAIIKSPSASWVDQSLSYMDAYPAMTRAGVLVGKVGYPSILIKGTSNVECIGSRDGFGCLIRAAANVQLVNEHMLKEYVFDKGDAICFASSDALNCSYGAMAQDQRESVRHGPTDQQPEQAKSSR